MLADLSASPGRAGAYLQLSHPLVPAVHYILTAKEIVLISVLENCLTRHFLPAAGSGPSVLTGQRE
jgi:hypothetical protein